MRGSMPLSERQRRMITTGRILVQRFMDDRCTTYASALAFSSMLSIVPFLALLFTIFKALNMHAVLAPMILSHVTAGSHELVTRMLHYIANTHVGSLGAAGLMTLLVAAMAILDSVEDAFNQIWSLERGKRLHHKLRDYVIVILSVPLLIALAVSITSSLQHQGVVQWFFRLPVFGYLILMLFRLVPYLSSWIALVFLYKFIPNVRVSLRNAVMGGVAAGTVWQVAQWAYIHFQVGVSRYNAIYGTLAVLPVFMVWIYTSWIIVLAGMEFVRYLQEGIPARTADVVGDPRGNNSQTPMPQGFPRD
ncbi:YihY/virulence factor BrkB family protein [Oryzomonas rubra]|uniref:YihY/virulence factor BrkB family protein n=2 Tax=Oryzomonas rubra TaxID=2509454 RepID=A0A5A9XGJ9_9BACT|nr:YihY/virulence factor BrkB family protein [Oryzomonas rubra]